MASKTLTGASVTTNYNGLTVFWRTVVLMMDNASSQNSHGFKKTIMET